MPHIGAVLHRQMHLGMQCLQDVLVSRQQPDASAREPGPGLSGTAHVELDPDTSLKDYWQASPVAVFVSSHWGET